MKLVRLYKICLEYYFLERVISLTEAAFSLADCKHYKHSFNGYTVAILITGKTKVANFQNSYFNLQFFLRKLYNYLFKLPAIRTDGNLVHLQINKIPLLICKTRQDCTDIFILLSTKTPQFTDNFFQCLPNGGHMCFNKNVDVFTMRDNSVIFAPL